MTITIQIDRVYLYMQTLCSHHHDICLLTCVVCSFIGGQPKTKSGVEAVLTDLVPRLRPPGSHVCVFVLLSPVSLDCEFFFYSLSNPSTTTAPIEAGNEIIIILFMAILG